MMNDPKYIRIKEILNESSYESFQNICIYGVLTFISPPKHTKQNTYSTNISLVDNSCEEDDKLKCLIFSNELEKSISSMCTVGDIIRFHRLRIQAFKGSPQGLASFWTSWVAFDKDQSNFNTRTNKDTISAINSCDYNIITELRNWLKCNPKLNALHEALLIPSTTNFLKLSANNKSFSDKEFHGISKITTKDLMPLSSVPLKGYFDMVCQVCAICSFKKIKFLVVWDATTPKISVHKETHFSVDSKHILFIPNTNFYFQVYIFDEHETRLNEIDIGDFILLKNLKSDKPKSLADTVIKLPGNGKAYGRTIIKLDTRNCEYPTEIIESIV